MLLELLIKIKKKILFGLKKFKIKKKPLLKKVDLNNNKTDLINRVVKSYKPEYIVDFASVCLVPESWLNPVDYFRINVNSKISFWKKMQEYKFLKKYIYISTPEIFGSSNQFISENSNKYNPSTPYALSKLTAENLIRLFQKDEKNKKFIIARFSNFYGPLQDENRLIPKVIKSIKEDKKFPLHGTGQTVRNFIYSDDFCLGIQKILKKGLTGKIYHFTSNEYWTIKNIVKKIFLYKRKQFEKGIKIVKDRKGKDFCYKLSSHITKNSLNFKAKTNLKKGIILISNFIENK